jgi:6-pyruvoyltetrahydropterin/6-carboxytetrahydropterin synthase
MIRPITLQLRPRSPGKYTAMFRVTREIEFCYGHRLLNYAGKCRYLHGHNGTAVIAIEAPQLDERGMVLDFSDIKRVVSNWIDENLDHRMILHRDDPARAALEKLGEPLYLLEVNPTAENIAKLIFDYARSQGFPIVECNLWETPRCYATYQA